MTHTLQNIIRGMGSVVDIAPTPRRLWITNPASGRSDADAVHGDWQRVGDDILRSIEHARAAAALDGQSQQKAT